MPKGRRRFTKEFKLQVIDEIARGKSLAQAASDYNITKSMICKWRRQYEKIPEPITTVTSNIFTYDARISESEKLVGRLVIENELLKKALKQPKSKC